jgi:signal peptidase I
MAIVVSTGKTKVPQNTVEEQKKRRQARVLLEGGIIIVALLFGLLLRVLAFEGVLITSGSMEPTLQRGDYTLLDHRVALRGSWQRGDVILFRLPASWEGSDPHLVKRVVGLPGEVVTLWNGRVYINDKLLEEPYLAELPNAETLLPLKLGPDQYYVMGDNRNFSDDSRENGPILEKEIQGRVLWRLWPRSRWGTVRMPSAE